MNKYIKANDYRLNDTLRAFRGCTQAVRTYVSSHYLAICETINHLCREAYTPAPM